MRKIPTLFVRDPDDRRHVIDEVTPGCEWVLAGEGVATRKYDGICILIQRDGLAVQAWARREVKPGKLPPAIFTVSEHDPVTGKTVGWERAEASGFAKYIVEAIDNYDDSETPLLPGTYELVGPKINGNPEAFPAHKLVAHATAQELSIGDRRFTPLRAMFRDSEAWPDNWEGIVFHHPDGRMAKIKRRDFV
jgi:hypothetical protein